MNGLWFVLGSLIAAQDIENTSEIEEILNSHLLFVYDDSGCRIMEGLAKGASKGDFNNYPIHRVVALTELGRRLQYQVRGQSSKYEESGIDFEERSPALDTIYLDTLEMEIAKVPEGFSLTELEELSQDLPCVKFVSRDDIKYAEEPGLRGQVINKSEIVLQNEGVPRFPINTNRPLSSQSTPLPVVNDPLYRYQWALKGPQSGAGFGIDAESVWATFEPQEETLIAIIDSGCTQNHPDMIGQFWKNPNELNCRDNQDDDQNGFVDDCQGWDFVRNTNSPIAEGSSSHGTAAAGIIAAKANNKQGIVGICPSCKLICLRFISTTEGTVVNEVRAIDYAIKMGARISNNSYGGYAKHGSKVEKEAIIRANKRGHLFVSSAGNNNLGTDNSDYIHTPSGYTVPNIISVGASTESGRKTAFSNFGKETVHVFAPGRNIISTGRDGYVVNQGTSFAAPHVAGVAGLIWSAFPQLSNVEVKNAIINSCRRTKDLENAAACGGVIDAVKALENAKQMSEKYRTTTTTPEPESELSDFTASEPEHPVPQAQSRWEWMPYGNSGPMPFFTISASSLYQVLPTAKKLINAPAHAFRDIARRAESVKEFDWSRFRLDWASPFEAVLDAVTHHPSG